jgi:hypothetical protein
MLHKIRLFQVCRVCLLPTFLTESWHSLFHEFFTFKNHTQNWVITWFLSAWWLI